MLKFYVSLLSGINIDKLYILIKNSSPVVYCASIYVMKLIGEVFKWYHIRRVNVHLYLTFLCSLWLHCGNMFNAYLKVLNIVM